MRTLQAQLKGLEHNYDSHGQYLATLARSVDVEIRVTNCYGQDQVVRRLDQRQTSISNFKLGLLDSLPGNRTTVTFFAPWPRACNRNCPWPQTNANSFAKENLDEHQAAKLLSHLEDSIVAATRYFATRRILEGNLWTLNYNFDQALSHLARDTLVDYSSIYDIFPFSDSSST